MFFRKRASYRRAGNDDDDSSSSSSSGSMSTGAENSTLFSGSFGTSNDGTAAMHSTTAMTVAGDAACMRFEDMMFGGIGGGGSGSVGEGTDSWLLSKAATKSTLGSWSNTNQAEQQAKTEQWTRRFIKPQQASQSEIVPHVSLSFESLMTNTVEQAGCMGFEWPSSSSDDDDDDDLEFDEDTVLSGLGSALTPQSLEDSDGGVGRLIQSSRIKSSLRKKAKKAEDARQAASSESTPRAMSPVLESWSAIKNTLSGGTDRSKGNDSGKLRGVATAAAVGTAGAAALAVGAASSGISRSDSQRKKSSGDKKNSLSRSQSAPVPSSESFSKKKFRSFWKRSKGGGYISDVQDDAELVPVATPKMQQRPKKRPDTPIVPSATTISKSIRYHPPGQGKRASGTASTKQLPKRQSPREVKLNHAVMVYGADSRQDEEEAPRAEPGKYIPSATLVRQMRCDDGRFSPTPVTAAPTHLYLPKNHTEMPYKQSLSSGGRSEATRTTTGARKPGGRTTSGARTVASRKSRGSSRYSDGRSLATARYTSSGKSTATRKTRGERSVSTRARSASRKRRQSLHDDYDVLGFLSPGSMEA